MKWARIHRAATRLQIPTAGRQFKAGNQGKGYCGREVLTDRDGLIPFTANT
jgi:hypothetical protein